MLLSNSSLLCHAKSIHKSLQFVFLLFVENVGVNNSSLVSDNSTNIVKITNCRALLDTTAIAAH